MFSKLLNTFSNIFSNKQKSEKVPKFVTFIFLNRKKNNIFEQIALFQIILPMLTFKLPKVGFPVKITDFVIIGRVFICAKKLAL